MISFLLIKKILSKLRFFIFSIIRLFSISLNPETSIFLTFWNSKLFNERLLVELIIINKKSITFNKESKENGELYGSIKPREISTAIFDKMKLEVKPSQIVLKSELNKIGLYKVDLLFHSEVSAKISIKIDKIQST